MTFGSVCETICESIMSYSTEAKRRQREKIATGHLKDFKKSSDPTEKLLDIEVSPYHSFPHEIGNKTPLPYDSDGIMAWYEDRKKAWQYHLMVGHGFRYGVVSLMHLIRTMRKNHNRAHRMMNAKVKPQSLQKN